MKQQTNLKSTAPLRNIELLAEAVEKAKNRPLHLDSFVTLSGPSGYGKSFAAAFVAVKFQYFYVEIGASWGVTTLLDKILYEIGEAPVKGVIAKKAEAVIDALVEHNKPLILDEFDYCVRPRYLEVIREIHDKARVPIILIGEELLPKKLEETERFHNRVINWVKAQPVTLEDAKKLANLYCKNLILDDELLQKLVSISQGRVRRVSVNLSLIKDEAELQGWKAIDLKTWGKRELYTGNAPAPRPVK